MSKKGGLVFGILLFALVFSIFSIGFVNADSGAGIDFVSCVDFEVPPKADPSIEGYIYVEFESGGILKSQEVYDKCLNERTVTEYFCRRSKPVKLEIPCESDETCLIGACTSESVGLGDGGSSGGSGSLSSTSNLGGNFFGQNNRYTYYECTDTENPSEPNPIEKGFIYVEYSEDDGPIQSLTVEDSCSGKTSLKEYWCKNTDAKFQPVLSVLPCDVGKTCDDGACVGGLVCNETDGGKVYSVYGKASGWDPFVKKYMTYEDQCAPNSARDEIYESYCEWTGEARREYVVCSNGCAENVCIEPAENGNTDDCIDTDGGINASDTGTVTGLRSIKGSSNWSFEDKCTTVNNMTGIITHVAIEGYCSANGEANTIWIDCPAGCTEGSCDVVSGATTGCTEIGDEGINFSEIGTVTGTHYGIGGWSLTDSCQRTYNRQNSYLTEGYCENGEAKYVNVLCDGDCLGATCDIGDASSGGSGSGGGDDDVGDDGNVGEGGGDTFIGDSIKTKSLLRYRIGEFFKATFNAIRL